MASPIPASTRRKTLPSPRVRGRNRHSSRNSYERRSQFDGGTVKRRPAEGRLLGVEPSAVATRRRRPPSLTLSPWVGSACVVSCDRSATVAIVSLRGRLEPQLRLFSAASSLEFGDRFWLWGGLVGDPRPGVVDLRVTPIHNIYTLEIQIRGAKILLSGLLRI